MLHESHFPFCVFEDGTGNFVSHLHLIGPLGLHVLRAFTYPDVWRIAQREAVDVDDQRDAVNLRVLRPMVHVLAEEEHISGSQVRVLARAGEGVGKLLPLVATEDLAVALIALVRGQRDEICVVQRGAARGSRRRPIF